MAEIKAHEFEQFAKRRSRDFRLFLVYGPDRGLVSERAGELAKLTGVDKSDAFSFMRLDASDVSSDPGRLFDEAYSSGLFGGDKLIWIKGAGADKAIAEAVTELAARIPDNVTIIIEAGDLKKGANLRKAAEQASGAVSIPCYADDAKSLNTLIDTELAAFGLRITGDARQALLDFLGGDRIASRNEIRKLALYAMGQPTIEVHHVNEIVGDASAISTDDAIDAILQGDRAGFLHATQKVVASKTPVFLVLQGCLRQFQLLDLMRADMDERRVSASDAMNTHARHLHFRRKPIVEAALRQWSAQSISIELSRLQSAVLQTRQRNTLEDTIAMQTLLATTLVAGRNRAPANR
ncbi:DNA polymerase III subunit delta [Rhizobium sp. KVB221]|uniref:DNA polymerase III subunit delta n=1 Tax=Rhizobium setariae TaxID=2801340 RepID=A0A936YP19_9HYPH|nr:DNA polymerase III subunit delta [Rhizobium setariae]MBL0374144.1 DNA polymerase III subunit delta [Rhizobium setariae]